MTLLSLLLVGLWVSGPPPPSPAPHVAQGPPSSGQSEAYLQFLLGRRLEAEGNLDGAIAAHRRAADLDLKSAEVRAELAGLFARQDRVKEALEWGEAALALDPDSREAHRTLGLVFGALLERPAAARSLGLKESTVEAMATRAAQHLERADSATLADASLHFTLGRVYVLQREYRKAIAVFRRLNEEEPGVSEASLLLADAYAGSGDVEAARRTLEALLAEEPSSTRARLQLAELDERDGRWSAAAQQYARLLEASPGNVELVSRQAHAWLRAGEPARSRDLLRPLTTGSQAGAAELYLLFQAQRDLDELGEAEATARLLMKRTPGDVRGPHALAQVFERRREHQAIVDLLQPIVTRDREDPRRARQRELLLTQLGFAYQELHRYDRAIATFEELRALVPSDSTSAVYVVQAYTVAGRLDEALSLAEQARRQFPDELRLVELQAETLRRQRRVDQGVALVREVLGTRETASLYITLSELYVTGGRFDEAANVLGQAHEKYPTDESVTFQLGSVYERAGRDGDAERTFRDLLIRDPLHAPTLNYLGYMLAERGRSLDEAVALISRALEVEPGNAAYLDSLGWAYFKLGRLVQAERNIREAAAELATNSVVQDHLGDVLMRLNRVTEAVAAWQRALAGDGDSIDRAAIEAKIREARARPGR